MIIRADGRGLTLIRQTEHAHLCGEMTEAWGNEGFEPVRPLGAVALAAAEHDNGWAEWENTPRLNPETGRPYTYIDIPIDQHQEIYRRGITRVIARDRYAGLLVSFHGSSLYSRFRSGQPGAKEFLEEQRGVQHLLLDAMRVDSGLRAFCEERVVTTNRDLVFAWDTLSLFLCHDDAWMDFLVSPCDYSGGRTRMAVARQGDAWVLDPYPFRVTPLALFAKALRTDRTEFEDDADLRTALEDAEEVELAFTIRATRRQLSLYPNGGKA